jgi:hypothetical protein
MKCYKSKMRHEYNSQDTECYSPTQKSLNLLVFFLLFYLTEMVYRMFLLLLKLIRPQPVPTAKGNFFFEVLIIIIYPLTSSGLLIVVGILIHRRDTFFPCYSGLV